MTTQRPDLFEIAAMLLDGKEERAAEGGLVY